MRCWRRLAAWNEAGVWDQLHQLLLHRLRSKNQLDWSRAVIDSSHPQSGSAGPKSGPSPVERARPGSEQHILSDGQGIPLAVSLTGGNRNDVTQLPSSARQNPQRSRESSVGPDAAPTCSSPTAATTTTNTAGSIREQGIRPVIAERGQPHGTDLETFRRVVERTISWLQGFQPPAHPLGTTRRHPRGFLGLAACLIIHRHVQRIC
jgi:hypothetical protein